MQLDINQYKVHDFYKIFFSSLASIVQRYITVLHRHNSGAKHIQNRYLQGISKTEKMRMVFTIVPVGWHVLWMPVTF